MNDIDEAGAASTTGSGIRMSAWRTFGISIVSGASTALGEAAARAGREARAWEPVPAVPQVLLRGPE